MLALGTIATAAQAQQAGRTREDVMRELAEARRMGDIVISGCGGGTFREAFPNKYPPRPVAMSTPAAPSDRVVEVAAGHEAAAGPRQQR